MNRKQGGKQDDAVPSFPLTPIPLLSDRPEENACLLHFEDLVDALVAMLAARDNPTPFVFLIDGPWGAGKTSLISTVMARLAPAVPGKVLRASGRAADDAGQAAVTDEPIRFLPRAVFEAPTQQDGNPRELAVRPEESDARIDWFNQKIVPQLGKSLPDTETLLQRYRPVRTVFFNAWRYRDQEEIFPALARELLAAMRADGFLAAFQTIVNEIATGDWREVIAQLSEAVPVAGGALAEAVRQPAWLRDIALWDRARPYIQGLSSAWATSYGLRADDLPSRLQKLLTSDVRNLSSHLRGLRSAPQTSKGELPGILAVFVDDLDRCPREHVAEVLKALNLLVDLDDTAFVLAADHRRVADVVALAYHDADGAPDARYGRDFLGKIVQLHLPLPHPQADDLTALLKDLFAKLRGPEPTRHPLVGLLEDHIELLARALPGNPREAKRFLNISLVWLFLVQRLKSANGRELDPATVSRRLKYLLLRRELPEEIMEDWPTLEALQQWAVPWVEMPDHRSLALGDMRRRDREAVQTLGPLQELWDSLPRDSRMRVDTALGYGLAKEERCEMREEDWTLFRSLSGPQVAEVAEPSEGGESDKAKERSTKKSEERAAAFAKALLSRLHDAKEPGISLATLLGEKGEPFTGDFAEAVGAALAAADPSEGGWEALAQAGQDFLRGAFDDSSRAKNETQMEWALFVRDLALENVRPAGDDEFDDPVWAQFGEAKVDPDPFMTRWWGEERAILAQQMKHPYLQLERLKADLDKEPSGDGRTWSVNTVASADVDGGEAPFLVEAIRGSDERWVVVPPGPFIAGGVESQVERPVRVDRSQKRTILVGAHPVTVDQFARFLNEGGYGEDLGGAWWRPMRDAAREALGDRRRPISWDHQEQHGNCPVVGVSWFESAAYCMWLNYRRGWKDAPWEGPYRLPTEAEWERAARGVLGRLWPWGCAWRPDLVVHGRRPELESLAPVAENLNTSPFGVIGMAGNVWEWTATRWQPKRFGARIHGKEALEKVRDEDHLSLRGGSFFNGRLIVRCAYRGRFVARYGFLFSGFRCVRDVI